MGNKRLEVVRVLLKNGAEVDALNNEGNTPLNTAIQNSHKDLEVIQEMLKYGADINIRNHDQATPLDNAINDLPCAKLLIKYALIKNFGKDYMKIVDLSPHESSTDYEELSCYRDKCIRELVQMKIIISNGLSLGQFLNTENASVALYLDNENTKCITNIVERIINYPVYNDMVSCKVTCAVERGNLLSQLIRLHVYTKSDTSNKDLKGKTVALNYVSICSIAKYLFVNDLLNFVVAFYDSNKRNIQSVEVSNNGATLKRSQLKIKLDEASTSSGIKRARLG